MCLQHECAHTDTHKGYMFIKQVRTMTVYYMKKYEFGGTLIQPKCKQQMSNEKPYVLQAVKPKIDVQYIQDDNFASPLFLLAALFLYCTVFCFVAKINRCVRVCKYPQCKSHSIEHVKMLLKTYNSCSGRTYNCRKIHTRANTFSASCMCVQHNMRWVFVIHKMHDNNKWERNISHFFPSLSNRKF